MSQPAPKDPSKANQRPAASPRSAWGRTVSHRPEHDLSSKHHKMPRFDGFGVSFPSHDKPPPQNVPLGIRFRLTRRKHALTFVKASTDVPYHKQTKKIGRRVECYSEHSRLLSSHERLVGVSSSKYHKMPRFDGFGVSFPSHDAPPPPKVPLGIRFRSMRRRHALTFVKASTDIPDKIKKLNSGIE